MQNLEIQTTERSRLPDVDLTTWGSGEILLTICSPWSTKTAVGPITRSCRMDLFRLLPGTGSLHYSQSAFEGLKAFHGADGVIRIFRPDMNAKRLANSCERLCLPEVDERTFKAAIRELVQIDKAWIPQKRGQALYIRPLIFGDEEHLDVRPSNR